MGNVFGKKQEWKVLMIGLDAAGKTTILYQLKLGEAVTTIPTIGFNVETVTYKNISMICWDTGMRDKMRPLIRHYYPNTNAIVFVIDSNDRDRMDEVKEYLHSSLEEDELRNTLLLVYANKQDIERAMSPTEMTERLGLNKITSHHWHIQPCCATTGDGLYEGLDWLAKGYYNTNDNVTDDTEVTEHYLWKSWEILKGWFQN